MAHRRILISSRSAYVKRSRPTGRSTQRLPQSKLHHSSLMRSIQPIGNRLTERILIRIFEQSLRQVSRLCTVSVLRCGKRMKESRLRRIERNPKPVQFSTMACVRVPNETQSANKVILASQS
ncbi:hypothetical protein Tcan_00213 [Toxocara canis]|uniref:Uncharacterized protein n=1 Tax=Toxocara canis TaxID=6265 RepID=A0A0B2V2A6_TOXCA|nr:hypothetical protein Tcan_00213 [Toxocara canis]